MRLQIQGCMVKPERVDKTIRKHASVAELDEIKAQEYRTGKVGPCMSGRMRFPISAKLCTR
jgi:hypothetical protein